MKRAVTAFAVLTVLFVIKASAQSDSTLQRVKTHVYTLAADSMMGRYGGSKYARLAAEYIVAEFGKVGIEPYGDGYFHKFKYNKDSMCNIVAVIPGNDPKLKDEYILIGAHYDHIGVESDGEPNNGADDNASGVAALIELGRNLSGETFRRSIMLVAFDGEEQGLHGSRSLAKSLEKQNVKVAAMMSVDMVGWLKDGQLKICNAATIRNGMEMLEQGAPAADDLKVVYKKLDTMLGGGSDQDSFVVKGIPALMVTTGLESVYHSVNDDADLIDYPGLVKITGHLARVTKTLDDSDELHFSGRLPRKHALSKRLCIGIDAGIGSGKVHYKYGATTGKSSITYMMGLSAYLRINNFLSLVCQPQYEWRRAQMDGGNLRSDNVILPMSIALTNNHSNSPVRVFLYAGGYYGQTLWGRTGDQPMDFNDRYSKWDAGAQYGLSLFMGPHGFGFVSRYSGVNLYEHAPMGASSSFDLRFRSTYFTLSYIF